LKVDNFDIISKTVKVIDYIPDEFVFIEGVNKPLDIKEVTWDFVLNKKTARELTYKMMYTGSSTGPKYVKPSLAIFGIENVTSENITLFRDPPKNIEIYSQKRITPIDSEHVLVQIELMNVGDLSVEKILVAEYVENARFESSTIRTYTKGEWSISELKPGEKWIVEYVTNDHELVENSPRVYSYESFFNLDSEVIIEKPTIKESAWREKRSILLESFILSVIILELLFVVYYFYKKPPKELDFAEVGITTAFTNIFWLFYDTFINKMPKYTKRTIHRIWLLVKYYTKRFFLAIGKGYLVLAQKIPVLAELYRTLKRLNKEEWIFLLSSVIDYFDKLFQKIKKYLGKRFEKIWIKLDPY
jgi:hypothetical protein